MKDIARRVIRDEAGMTALEKLGIAVLVVTALSFIPAARGLLGDAYDAIFKQTVIDEATGEEVTTAFSIATRGILVTIVSIVAFLGTGFLLLYTNLGKRLAFLITGAATFGWLVVGGGLFVVYAPRGLRPANVEGLNSFQIRVPAIALTLGSMVLFAMFVVALDRFERSDQA